MNQLVSQYGHLWARNQDNIRKLRGERTLYGVYVLCDGCWPVYIGRGKLFFRIVRHHRSKSRGQFWSHFSWFAIDDSKFRAETEALVIRILPFFSESLNKQRRVEQANAVPIPIKYPTFAIKKKHK
jgi:hypothetical protein